MRSIYLDEVFDSTSNEVLNAIPYIALLLTLLLKGLMRDVALLLSSLWIDVDCISGIFNTIVLFDNDDLRRAFFGIVSLFVFYFVVALIFLANICGALRNIWGSRGSR
jgi:hypothetical protein